jgi:hypothetical protein
VVIVLAIGPRVRGFKCGRGRQSFKGDKNPRSKTGGPMLLRVYSVLKIPSVRKRYLCAKFTEISCFATRSVCLLLPNSSGGLIMND